MVAMERGVIFQDKHGHHVTFKRGTYASYFSISLPVLVKNLYT